jgi:hypothetical protein
VAVNWHVTGLAVREEMAAEKRGALSVEYLAVDASEEIERFSRFDHATRRFIAYALELLPLPPGTMRGLAAPLNKPRRFEVPADEHTAREAGYAKLLRLREVSDGTGPLDTLLLADLIEAARLDVRTKRLRGFAAYAFLYERLVGRAWRELLIVGWREAIRQRRRKGAAIQLPLDARLRRDAAFLRGLAADPAPSFYPSLADADAIGIPLIADIASE